ncbi:unnamed protein product [Urochloa decumbens]|uniref:F-box domain-containing protein n=1 Tax=Urochloa decumbens TaxID=240449 RepID=A0ABC9FPA1_9POAL
MELLIEILLLLPAKEVCRVRAVCPSWRSLTYDPLFVPAYAARRRGPLLAVHRGNACIDLVDVSGDVVKRIRTNMESHELKDLTQLSGAGFPVWNLWIAFGQVASTGEYKLVRIVEDSIFERVGEDPVCEVFTFREGTGHWGKKGNPAAYRGRNRQWRQREHPPARLDPSCTNGVTVKGDAYFLFARWQLEESYIDIFNIEPDCIPSFNLEMEQWSVSLKGPFSRILEESDGMLSYSDLVDRLMLGELKDSLVTVHCNNQISTTDLWFLMDFENRVWSKQHIIQMDIIPGELLVGVQPLLELDEGGIILLVQIGSRDVLQFYNPGANNVTNLLDITTSSSYVGVGIYTGSFLC